MNETEERSRRQSFKAYYLEPQSERGNFAYYMEESGVNAILIEAVSKLLEVTDKPENPMEWLRLYFRQFDPDRTEQLEEAEQSLKDAVIKQESKLTYLRIRESRLKERLETLQYKEKQPELEALQENQDDNYHRYKDHADDFRWRIKPDPSFHVKKGDILGEIIEQEGIARAQKHRREPTGTQKKIPEQEEEVMTCRPNPENNYNDYPHLYFGAEAIELKEEFNVDSEVKKIEEGMSLTNNEGESGLEYDEEEYNYGDSNNEVESLKSNPSSKRASRYPGKSPRDRKKTKKFSKPIATPQPPAQEVPPENQARTSVPTSEPGSGPAKERLGSQGAEAGDEGGEALLIQEQKRKTRTSLRNSKNKGKNEPRVSKTEEPVPLPEEDPLALELPPVDHSFWKYDFSVTRGREGMFAETNEFDFDEDELDENENVGAYLSSRREMRHRKFRSQIIDEAFWKPDRGKSIQFDSNFDLTDVPILSSQASGMFAGPKGNVSNPKLGPPSHVSAVASDDSTRHISSTGDGPQTKPN